MTEHEETYMRCVRCCMSMAGWVNRREGYHLVICTECCSSLHWIVDVPIPMEEWHGRNMAPTGTHVVKAVQRWTDFKP